MAEGYCRELGAGVECASAGMKPAPMVDPYAIEAMREAGIDISRAKPRGFDDIKGRGFDYLVTLGCRAECPFLPGAKMFGWDIPDPHGKDLDEYRRIRDIIRREVSGLLASLDLLKHRPSDNHQPLA